ncbi:hypothetical protein TMatcc_002348 [Talaromyces marneffei ATCC 18224]
MCTRSCVVLTLHWYTFDRIGPASSHLSLLAFPSSSLLRLPIVTNTSKLSRNIIAPLELLRKSQFKFRSSLLLLLTSLISLLSSAG